MKIGGIYSYFRLNANHFEERKNIYLRSDSTVFRTNSTLFRLDFT